MFVETLQMGRLPDPARQAEALAILSDETARLSALINRLLDWARMESGKRAYHFRAEPVSVVVDAALRAFESQLLASPATLRRELPDDLPLVRCDREAMVEALLNLFQNAYKYTGPDKEITVGARVEGPTVLITVGDNGPGIAARDQKKIFEKFYRAKDPLDRTIEGSGLGLPMVKHIVNAHRGKVSVASQLGAGTTFTVALPVAVTA